MSTGDYTRFPENPQHGDIFELKPGLLYQWDAGVSSWLEIQSSSVNLELATPIRKGAMSSVDLKKLNRLVLPPPQSTIVGNDCIAPFQRGTIDFFEGDNFVGVSGDVDIRNIDEFGDTISESHPFHIHQHTYGFDFTLDLPELIKELIDRGQIQLEGKLGEKGDTGPDGEPGVDEILTGPKGVRGPTGLAPPCELSLDPEPISAEKKPGLKRALVSARILDHATDRTKYVLEFDRQVIGTEDATTSEFNVRASSSYWVLAVGSVAGTPQPVFYLDIQPIIDSVHSKFLSEVDRLKQGYEDIVEFWIQTMSDLFDEQKAALCCALEWCMSVRKSIDQRQHMESVAASAIGANGAKINLHGRNSGEAVEISQTRLNARLPDGTDLCEGGPQFPQNPAAGGGGGGGGGGGQQPSPPPPPPNPPPPPPPPPPPGGGTGTETFRASIAQSIAITDANTVDQLGWSENGTVDLGICNGSNALDVANDNCRMTVTMPGTGGPYLSEWITASRLENGDPIPENSKITRVKVTVWRSTTQNGPRDFKVQIAKNARDPKVSGDANVCFAPQTASWAGQRKAVVDANGQPTGEYEPGQKVEYVWNTTDLDACGGFTDEDVNSGGFGFAMSVDLAISGMQELDIEGIEFEVDYEPAKTDGNGDPIIGNAFAAQVSDSISTIVTVDALLNVATIKAAKTVELPKGRYSATLKGMDVRVAGKYGIPPKLQFISNGTRKAISFLSKGNFDSLKDSKNAYEGLAIAFEHDGGPVHAYLPILPTPDASGQAAIAIEPTGFFVRKQEEPVAPKPKCEPKPAKRWTPPKVEVVEVEEQAVPFTCSMTASHLNWYQNGWDSGNCCGLVVNVGGQDYIVFKRGIGDDDACGGGESTSTPCISSAKQHLGIHPAFAWPTFDKKTFAPISGDSVTFRFDEAMNKEVQTKIERTEYDNPKGNPAGFRHLAYQLSAVLFPST